VHIRTTHASNLNSLKTFAGTQCVCVIHMYKIWDMELRLSFGSQDFFSSLFFVSRTLVCSQSNCSGDPEEGRTKPKRSQTETNRTSFTQMTNWRTWHLCELAVVGNSINSYRFAYIDTFIYDGKAAHKMCVSCICYVRIYRGYIKFVPRKVIFLWCIY